MTRIEKLIMAFAVKEEAESKRERNLISRFQMYIQIFLSLSYQHRIPTVEVGIKCNESNMYSDFIVASFSLCIFWIRIQL